MTPISTFLHRPTVIFVVATASFLIAGCGKKMPTAQTSSSKKSAANSTNANESSNSSPTTPPRVRKKPLPPDRPAAPPQPHERATLVDLAETAQRQNDPQARLPSDPQGDAVGFQMAKVRAEKAAAAGLRMLTGKHLVLVTDLPSQPDVDELPAAFDAAVPQWTTYFEIDPAKTATWKIVGYLMRDKERFVASGAFTPDLPDFPHGWQRGFELWLFEQPSSYYRRHLLLHEGAHAFMSHWLNGVGPPWYAEGMAELLATHRWANGELKVRYFPANRDEVSHWGRVKIIRDDFAARQGKSLEQIMQYGPRDHFQVQPYGWCWGATAFFDNHPKFAGPFRELKKNARVTSEDFSRQFREAFGAEWRNVSEEWQVFVANIDYGYDLTKAVVERRAVVLLPAEGATVKVAVDRGWQSSGFRLEEGKSYHVTATGRFQIARQPKTWWCEPGGVTIRYHQSRPLGQLLGAIVAEDQPLAGLSPLAAPDSVGVRLDVTAVRAGTLFFRVNESFAELSDNVGEIVVRIVPK